jgi:amino acid adenylation domain-containing protein
MLNKDVDGSPVERSRKLLEEFLAPLGRLSYAQRRIWFLEQLEPGTKVHHLSAGLRLSGALQIPRLERALTRVLERQAVLRSVFVAAPDGEPRQRLLPPSAAVIPVSDLTRLPDQSLDSEAYRLAWLEAQAPFDLVNGPLIRVRVLKLRDTDHILLFTLHHIVSDGISVGLFTDELAAFYQQEIGAAPASLPELPLSYADYAEWQLSTIESDELQPQIAFWRNRLAGAPPVLDLPSDRPRPREQSMAGASTSGPLPDGLTSAAREVCNRHEVTPFCFFLAAFAVLLYRHSGVEDICIAVPVAGRNQLEIEKLIGLFVNLLVVRIDLSGNPRFVDVLLRTQRALLDAHANQELPFEAVVEKLQPQRSLAYHPLVQVMATSFHAPLKTGRFGPLGAKPYAVGSTASQFELSAFFIEGADRDYWWQLDYSTTLFDDSRIQRMRRHFEQLARAAAAAPEGHVGGLPLLTPADAALLAVWNDTREYLPGDCLHELVARQAQTTPQRAAVEFDGRVVLYADLDLQAERLASRLIAKGAGEGARVGICLERSAEMVIGLLAILKSGAAYVPMDPAYPIERLSFMMRDAGIRLLVTRRDLLPALEAFAEEIVYLGAQEQESSEAPLSRRPQDPESLAYLIYTSGSTGAPKGVCVPHRAVVNLLSSMSRSPGLGLDDRLLAVTTVSFDIAAMEIFLPLVTGATVVMTSADASVDGVRLLGNIVERAITAMQATPATWRLLIEAGWTRDSAQIKVLCGGEALPQDLAAQLGARSDSVWNLYGPTETTIWSGLWRVEPTRPVMIGRPIANTEFHVVDARLQPVPVGVPGELLIGGAGVAKGYWNRVELSNERFIPDTFGSPRAATLYRTGDEVRRHENGELEYLRRLDSQVKLRGFRVEPGEIESVLVRQPSVDQAVVVVRKDTPGDDRLVAYVVPSNQEEIDTAELLGTLRRTLPEYMIPFIVALEALPFTPSGKIDRQRLPAPGSLDQGAQQRIFPRDDVERRVATIWEAVLGLQPIAVRDSFFDLGGHSLLAVRVFAQIRATFGISLPLATLFHNPTIEHLAAQLQRGHSRAASTLIALRTEGGLAPFFLGGSSPRYLELAHMLGPDQPCYKLDLYALTEQRVAAGLAPHTRFEDCAADFLRDIRSLQPRGPYFLGGGCDGGILALELARQLQAAGESVGLLVIWETPRTGFFERDWLASALHMGKLLQAPFRTDAKRRELRLGPGHQQDIPAASPEENQHLFIYNAFWSAIRSYSSQQPFRGRIVYIRARRQYRTYKDVLFGWEQMAAAGLEVHNVPGDHFSYATEFEADFANALRTVLEGAHAQALSALRPTVATPR